MDFHGWIKTPDLHLTLHKNPVYLVFAKIPKHMYLPVSYVRPNPESPFFQTYQFQILA